MPELPDVVVYVERLQSFTVGRTLQRIRIRSPFVVRSVDPPIDAAEGRVVRDIARLGKRIVMTLDDDLHLVIHLMIAGRLRWRDAGASISGRTALAAFDFEHGSLITTEASPKKRASIHLVRGAAALAEHDRGGLEVLECDLPSFAARLRSESHTLKRALTDPQLFSGIGNAYSDEILHRARLSPILLTGRLDDEQVGRLFDAARETLREWTDRLRRQVGEGFPDKVTAFRPEMAVHGRFDRPCPVCGTSVQRIVYADRETNYCPGCQTNGRLLRDRSLSRLLREEWPDGLF